MGNGDSETGATGFMERCHLNGLKDTGERGKERDIGREIWDMKSGDLFPNPAYNLYLEKSEFL